MWILFVFGLGGCDTERPVDYTPTLPWGVPPPITSPFRLPLAQAESDTVFVSNHFDHRGVDYACGGHRYREHLGTDFALLGWDAMDAGVTVVAAAAGHVVEAEDGWFDRCADDCPEVPALGNHVVLRHTDGWETVYAHMRTESLTVEVGDVVACGDILGEVGSSGNSGGPHLHFESRGPDGLPYDPFLGPCSDTTAGLWHEQRDGGLPSATCAPSPPELEPVATMRCGDVFESATDAPESTKSHLGYACSPDQYLGSGIALRVDAERHRQVQLTLHGKAPRVALIALEGTAVMQDHCIDTQNRETGNVELISFAHPGGPVVVVVADLLPRASEFRLQVDCLDPDRDLADAPAL
jgi:murein DD-endopeptidase MepM/ murein hydrolase activator NlpD